MKKAKKEIPKVPVSRGLIMSVFQMYLGARMTMLAAKNDREAFPINVTGINCNDVNPWIDCTWHDRDSDLICNSRLGFKANVDVTDNDNKFGIDGYIDTAKLILRDPTNMLVEDAKNVQLICSTGLQVNTQYILAHLSNPSILLATDATIGYFKMLQAHHYLVKRMYNMPIPLPFDGAAGKTPVDLGLAILDNTI